MSIILTMQKVVYDEISDEFLFVDRVYGGQGSSYNSAFFSSLLPVFLLEDEFVARFSLADRQGALNARTYK